MVLNILNKVVAPKPIDEQKIPKLYCQYDTCQYLGFSSAYSSLVGNDCYHSTRCGLPQHPLVIPDLFKPTFSTDIDANLGDIPN